MSYGLQIFCPTVSFSCTFIVFCSQKPHTQIQKEPYFKNKADIYGSAFNERKEKKLLRGA